MRILPAVLLLALTGCAGSQLDLEPVADALDRAKVEHSRAVAISAAVYHVVCEAEPPLEPKATCVDLASAIAQGESASREALNLAIKAFNQLEAIAEEVAQ